MERFSLTDADLGLAADDRSERTSFVQGWVARQPSADPSPREELARVFFVDAMRAALRIH